MNTKLTFDERVVLVTLTDAWNYYCKLPNKNSDDVEEFQSDSQTDVEQALRNSVRRRITIGVIMFVAFFSLVPIMTFLIRISLPIEVLTILIIICSLVGLQGAFISLYYWSVGSPFFRGIDILHQIAPPEPFIVGKAAVLNKDPVYVINKWGISALFFVVFKESERSFDNKVRLPSLLGRWEDTYLNGIIRIARKEDNFVVPVDTDTYCKGEGIIYALLLEIDIFGPQKDYSVDLLNTIVRCLADEVVSHGSDTRLFDDEFE